jgi:hypothetical protein
MRSEMETLANNFDAELVALINRAKYMADSVVPCTGPEHFIAARNLIQRTRYKGDRARHMTGEDYDRINGILRPN